MKLQLNSISNKKPNFFKVTVEKNCILFKIRIYKTFVIDVTLKTECSFDWVFNFLCLITDCFFLLFLLEIQ